MTPLPLFHSADWRNVSFFSFGLFSSGIDTANQWFSSDPVLGISFFTLINSTPTFTASINLLLALPPPRSPTRQFQLQHSNTDHYCSVDVQPVSVWHLQLYLHLTCAVPLMWLLLISHLSSLIHFNLCYHIPLLPLALPSVFASTLPWSEHQWWIIYLCFCPFSLSLGSVIYQYERAASSMRFP